MTDTHDSELDRILDRYTAYCDQWNREVMYDTRDNVDRDETEAALTRWRDKALLDARIDEICRIQQDWRVSQEAAEYLEVRLVQLQQEQQ